MFFFQGYSYITYRSLAPKLPESSEEFCYENLSKICDSI